MIDFDEINAIASDPDEANAFFINDFAGLLNVVENIATFACGQGKFAKFLTHCCITFAWLLWTKSLFSNVRITKTHLIKLQGRRQKIKEFE